jgi:hypothetical protein
MKHIGPGILAIVLLAATGPAIAQPNQLNHDEAVKAKAERAHQQALKSGDKTAIAASEAQIRAADEDIFNDKKDAALTVPAGISWQLRKADQALIQAKEAHQRAVASGDPATIKSTQAALREAYNHRYAVLHAAPAKR